MARRGIVPVIIAVVVVVAVVVSVGAFLILNGASSENTTITGNVMKGSVSDAFVKIYALDSDGTKGDLLGAEFTDENGTYTIPLESPYSGQMLVEASGGTYVNEVSGATDSLSDNDSLTAVLPAGTTQAAITPLTHMAAARAMVMAAENIPLATAIDAANVGVAQQYNLSNILDILPVNANNATQVATSSSDQREYGIILAGIAQEAENLNVRPIDLAAALATDMEDGTLDGMGEGQIQVPTITGSVITLPSNAGTAALQTAINTFLASGNNLTNLTGTSIATTPVNINPAGGSFYITAAALPAWKEGQSGSAILTANGGTPPHIWTVTVGSALPYWLSLVHQDNNVVLTGTAPELSPGTTRSISPPFSVTCTDSAGHAQAISWTVTIVKAGPTITPRSITVTSGTRFEETIATASGGVSPTYIFVCPARCPLGTIVDLNGVISGTIDISGTMEGRTGQPKTYSFEVEAVDAIGSTSSATATVTVNPPELSISPTSQSFDASGGSGSVTVTGSSSWTAVSNAAWIAITSGSSGSGNGTVSHTVSTNSSTSQRTGTMTIAGHTFTVTQAGSTSSTSTGVSQFDGYYTGSYDGADYGSVAFTVSNGVITVSYPGNGSGTVSAAGSTSFSGAGGYAGATYSFSGTFVVSSGTASASGSWTGSMMGMSGSGTWSATRY